MSISPAAEGILFTDQYQLTMAQLYFRLGIHEKPAQFDHYYRTNPNYGTHQAGYAINAGLGWLLEHMHGLRFTDEDLAYLRSMTTSSGRRLFEDAFLQWLKQYGNFEALSMQAIPEGRVVHPNTPLTVVTGPLAMAQILETPLLNHLNYQILIATKAARIRQAGRGRPLLEFGLRRAHDKAGNAGARAALIGGADFSSNAGISHVLGIPPKGTHAHSMVQAFMALGEGELGAFRAYADLYPDDCLLLVDTVDTLNSGVPNAITVFEELRAKGYEPNGIRLDSGDLAYLSVQAAKMLNEAGFPNANIVLSNQIDELNLLQIIAQIKDEAPRYGLDAEALIQRLVYGVGTRLITSEGSSSLDGVYKLVAIQKDSHWEPAIKISESSDKIPTPGKKTVWRIYDKRHKATADLIAGADEDILNRDILELHHPSRHGVYRELSTEDYAEVEPLLVDILQEGTFVADLEPIDVMRQRRIKDLEYLDSGVKRIINPHLYHVSVTPQVWQLKQDQIKRAKNAT